MRTKFPVPLQKCLKKIRLYPWNKTGLTSVSFKERKIEKKSKCFVVAFQDLIKLRKDWYVIPQKNKCQLWWSKINGLLWKVYLLWYVPLLCFLIMTSLEVKTPSSSQRSICVKIWQKICNESLDLEFLIKRSHLKLT